MINDTPHACMCGAVHGSPHTDACRKPQEALQQARVLALEARVDALQDGMTAALSVLAQLQVGCGGENGHDHPLRFEPHTRTHLLGLAVQLRRLPTSPSLEDAARKYAGLPATTGDAGSEAA